MDTKLRTKKLEFMQRVARNAMVASFAAIFYIVTLNFALLWFDKQSMTQETINAITVFGGIVTMGTTAAYTTLTAVRNCSLNKLEEHKNNNETELKKGGF